MNTFIKNYIITFIDKDNKEQIMDSKCHFHKTLKDKPLYDSYENALKSLTKIKNYLKKERTINFHKEWYEISIQKKDKEDFLEFHEYCIENYLNIIHINKNDTLQIREVNIEININKKL